MFQVNLKMGKKGEIILPAFIRKKYGLRPGKTVKVNMSEKGIEIAVKDEEVIKRFRDIAKREGIPASKLLYGDELYEKVFG